MKNLRNQWLEKMKNWTKKTMVEKDERLNKVKIAKNLKRLLRHDTKRAFVKFILKLPLLYNSIDRYV